MKVLVISGPSERESEMYRSPMIHMRSKSFSAASSSSTLTMEFASVCSKMRRMMSFLQENAR